MGLDILTVERVWEWSKGHLALWMQALADLRSVMVSWDLESPETLVKAMEFSLFAVALGRLISFPADRYMNCSDLGIADILVAFIFTYLLVVIGAGSHFIVARLFMGSVTLRGAIILALTGSAYLPIFDILPLFYMLDQGQVGDLKSQMFKLHPVITTRESVFGGLAFCIAVFILIKFVRAVAFVNKVGLFRATLISTGAGVVSLIVAGLVSESPLLAPGCDAHAPNPKLGLLRIRVDGDGMDRAEFSISHSELRMSHFGDGA